MAKLCTSYLTFDFFKTSLEKAVLQEQVTVGFFAFQEYATLNWLCHITYLLNQDKEDGNGEFASLHEVCRSLERRHNEPSSHQVEILSLNDRRRRNLTSKADVDRLRARYDAVLSLSDSEECYGNPFHSWGWWTLC